jgi:arsenite-transporting ATPase
VPFVFSKHLANPESQIPNPAAQFVFYGGKGGVGKTTCAAARAIADAARGAHVLVVSTDPAHSLGDALGVRLSATPRLIPLGRPGEKNSPGRPAPRRSAKAFAPNRSAKAFALNRSAKTFALPGSLHAVELDAPRAFARWIASHRQALGDIVEHGTWLDRHDVDALMDLPIPGVDELVGMVEIVRLASASYDVVIIDTAPTGHTLRLLSAPDTVASVADVLDELQQEHRLIREQFARGGRPEAADRLIALMADEAHDTRARLSDRARTDFEWVMLPEALSLAESADGLRALDRARVPVREIIVNRVIPPGSACPICDRRRAEERQIIARTLRTLGRTRRIRAIAAETREPRGMRALAAFGRSAVPIPRRAKALTARPLPLPRALSAPAHRPTISPEDLAAIQGASLLFFGGKGGVGKTTVAAATAVRLARADPSRRVLLLSTDPAHSLGDVLGVTVGDRPAPVRGGPANLHVRELDASAALAARRADLEAALADVVATFGDQRQDEDGSAPEAVGRLMDLAPPGIDELFGVLTVVQAQREYPVIIVDMAPTGHALRLLEMPDAARDWVQVLLRVLLKYRSIVRPGRLAAELIGLSKSIRELQDRVRDRTATRFIVVTRAADVPRQETERLLDRLRRLHLAVPAIVINARTMAAGRCPRCRATKAGELEQQAALQARCARKGERCVIIQTPLSAPPPRGVAALDRWARTWTLDDRKRGRTPFS